MSRRNLIFLLAIICSACSSDLFLVHSGNIPSEERISQIRNGQTKQDVMNILGAPSLTTGLSDDHWIYMASTVKKVAFFKPEEIDRKVLAITFENNKISKVEEKTLTDANNISIDEEVTESSERQQGFFRKYFGGVGSYTPFGGSNNKEM